MSTGIFEVVASAPLVEGLSTSLDLIGLHRITTADAVVLYTTQEKDGWNEEKQGGLIPEMSERVFFFSNMTRFTYNSSSSTKGVARIEKLRAVSDVEIQELT